MTALREEVGKPGTNWTQVTPENRKKVAPLVRHWMGKAKPFTECVRELAPEKGEEAAKRICAVVKDMGMRTTKWRKGPVKEEALIVARETARLLLALDDDGDVALIEAYARAGGAAGGADMSFGERLIAGRDAEQRLSAIQAAIRDVSALAESESEEARALLIEAVECAAIIEAVDLPRHRDGKWTNLLRRLDKKRNLKDAYRQVKAAGHAGGGGPVQEAVIGGIWTETKHKRGAVGTSSGGKFVSQGATGGMARAVQRKVGAKVDGIFGPNTHASVRQFQQRNGLKVDGVVGHQTASAMLGRRNAQKMPTGALTATDRTRLRERGKRAPLREDTDPAEVVQEGVLPLSREELSALAKRRRRDPHGRFADEMKRLGPGGSFQIGNVNVRHVPGQGGVEHYAVTKSAKGSKSTERVAGKGAASRIAQDLSARDDHPDSIGGKKAFGSLKDYNRQTGRGGAPHDHDDLEEHGRKLLGPGAWDRKTDANVAALTKTGDPLKFDTQKQHQVGGMYTAARLELHAAIARTFLHNVPSQDSPEALFMAGGPASGKSTMLKQGATDKPPDSVLINPDAIKGMLPEYESLLGSKDANAASYVHEESSDIAKMIVGLAQERKMNLTVDKTKIKPEEVKAFQAAGYNTRGAVATVKIDDARARAKARGDKTGRYVRDEILIPGHHEVSIKWETWARDTGMNMVLMDTGANAVIAVAQSGVVKTVDEALYTNFKLRASDRTV